MRETHDIDLWQKDSQFNKKDLAAAVESSGLDFNPTDEFVEHDFVQIIEPGTVQIGHCKSWMSLYSGTNLDVVSPPIANVVASKLVRGDEKDIDDIVFFASRIPLDRDDILEIIEEFNEPMRTSASENLVFLDALNLFDNTFPFVPTSEKVESKNRSPVHA